MDLWHNGWAAGSHRADLIDLLKRIRSRFPTVQTIGRATTVVPLTAEEARPNSMSAHTGLGPQPLHTDCAHWPAPPRFIIFECLNGGHRPCGTSLLRPELAELCSNPSNVVVHSGWIASANPKKRSYCSVVERIGCSQFRVRFDPCCMINNYVADAPKRALAELVSCAEVATVQLQSNDWLVLDNWRLLHGRAPGAHLSRERRLRRTYLGA